MFALQLDGLDTPSGMAFELPLEHVRVCTENVPLEIQGIRMLPLEHVRVATEAWRLMGHISILVTA